MATLTWEYDYGQGFAVGAPPKNHADTRIQLVWSNGVPSATLQSINYQWVGTEAQKLIAYRESGKTGGTGILEGPGLRISVGSTVLFYGCIDTANQSAKWECDNVKCPIKKTTIDWFKETASSFTFAHLKRIGMITAADYKKTPYTVSMLEDGPMLAMLILEELAVGQQLYKESVDITNLITHAGGEATGTATVVGAPADGPNLVASILEIALEIGYLITLVGTVAINGKQIFDLIVPLKKYKYCMRIEDMFLKALQYMASSGPSLQFSSTILRQGTYKNSTIMPAKRIMPKSGQSILSLFERAANEINTSKSYGHFDGTFSQLIDACCRVWNGDIAIKNNTLFFEEKHGFNFPSNYQLPNEGPEGYTYNYPDPNTPNISELQSCYELHFLTDETDLNTIYQYKGTTAEVCIYAPNMHESNNVLLQGFKQVEIPFALAKRKEYLNNTEQFLDSVLTFIDSVMQVVENIVNGVITVINSIIGWFGGSSIPQVTLTLGLGNIMNGRIGWMELGADAFNVPKIFIGSNANGDWQIHPNNENDMSCDALMRNFHGKNLATRGNQYLLYGTDQPVKIKFCLQDFLTIQDNNTFTTADNKKGKFDSVEWEVESDIAHAKFRVNENYTNNLQETITIDGN